MSKRKSGEDRYPLDRDGGRILPQKHDSSIGKIRIGVRDFREGLSRAGRDVDETANWKAFVHKEQLIRRWMKRYGVSFPVHAGTPQRFKSSGLEKRPSWAHSQWERYTMAEVLWMISTPLEAWEVELQRRHDRDAFERRRYGKPLIAVREELEEHMRKRPNPRAFETDELYRLTKQQWTRRRHVLQLVTDEKIASVDVRQLVHRIPSDRLEELYPSLREVEVFFSESKLRGIVRNLTFRHRLGNIQYELARRSDLDQDTDDIRSMDDLAVAERSLGIRPMPGLRDRFEQVFRHLLMLGATPERIDRDLRQDGLVFTEQRLKSHEQIQRYHVFVDTDIIIQEEPEPEVKEDSDREEKGYDLSDFVEQALNDIADEDAKPRGPRPRTVRYIRQGRALERLGKHSNLTSRVYALAGAELKFSELRDLGRLDEVEANLLSKYPYAGEVIGLLTSMLRENFMSGKAEIYIRPIILVGEPGSGKTSLLRDFAAELDLPNRQLSVGGMRDGNVFGTSAGWSTAMPSIMTDTISEELKINPLLILDEIDKAHTTHNGSVHQELLALLEPDEATSYFDKGLRTHVDASHISWALTANSLDPIPSHLLSRCTVVEMPQPEAQHVGQIARQILADHARGRGLDPRFFRLTSDDIEWLEETFDQHRSARVLRELVIRSIEDPTMEGPVN